MNFGNKNSKYIIEVGTYTIEVVFTLKIIKSTILAPPGYR